MHRILERPSAPRERPASALVAGRRPALLVFSDDWGRHPSSCQHLVRRLLTRYPVYWVNVIGMRRPVLDGYTVRRGLEKLRDWTRADRTRAGQAAPCVLSPLIWPWFTCRHDRWLNRLLLERQLAPIVRGVPFPIVAVTTVPLVVDLIGRLPVARWVYYRVDDFRKWPALDQRAIAATEDRLIRQADVVIAASELLRQGAAERGRQAGLLTHGVDLDRWLENGPREEPPQLHGLERPLALFWGSIDWQMDLDFVRRLSRDMTKGTIVLVGPVTDPDPSLLQIPRVVHVPPVPYETLPWIAQEAAVVIMPYVDAPGLRESQPLKLKEYLASGKPAVVRDLPANRLWADALDLVATPEEFSDMVRKRLDGGLPESQADARRRLRHETWDEKARQFERLAMLGPVNELELSHGRE